MSSVYTNTIDTEDALDFSDEDASSSFHTVRAEGSSDIVGIDGVQVHYAMSERPSSCKINTFCHAVLWVICFSTSFRGSLEAAVDLRCLVNDCIATACFNNADQEQFGLLGVELGHDRSANFVDFSSKIGRTCNSIVHHSPLSLSNSTLAMYLLRVESAVSNRLILS